MTIFNIPTFELGSEVSNAFILRTDHYYFPVNSKFKIEKIYKDKKGKPHSYDLLAIYTEPQYDDTRSFKHTHGVRIVLSKVPKHLLYFEEHFMSAPKFYIVKETFDEEEEED